VTGAGADDSGQAAFNPFLAFVAQTNIFEQEAGPTVRFEQGPVKRPQNLPTTRGIL